MREIKFRAWDKVNKRIIKSVGFTDSDCGRLWQREESTVDDHSNFTGSSDKWIPMQFTGLFDKNGKEIYEGDILKHDLWGVDAVVWDSVCAGFRCQREEEDGHDLSFCDVHRRRVRVIGNVWENPDLLK